MSLSELKNFSKSLGVDKLNVIEIPKKTFDYEKYVDRVMKEGNEKVLFVKNDKQGQYLKSVTPRMDV